MMLYKDICKILAYFFFCFSLILLVPTAIAAYYQFVSNYSDHPQLHSTSAFLITAVITFIISLLLYFFGKNAVGQIFRKESIIIVVIIWFVTPFLAGLPFLLSNTLQNPWQAFFETSSGLTTTGSTILTAKKFDQKTGTEIPIVKEVKGQFDVLYRFYGTVQPVTDQITGKTYQGIEAVGKALLFWRSFLQFLGGGGVIVLFVAILPLLGSGGKILFQSEIPGPIKNSLTPRIKEGAKQLWVIYLGLTCIQFCILFLFFQELSLLDIITLSFSTISTGGFSVKNEGIAAYHDASLEWVLLLFMILGSINFSLYFYALRGKFYRIYESEFFFYLASLLFFGAYCSWNLIGNAKMATNGNSKPFYDLIEAVRYSFFQVVSIQSTTGYTTTDYDHWPYVVQVILLIIMFFGGMSGSTAGGIKIIRLTMLYKIVKNTLQSIFQPDAIKRIQIDGKEISSKDSVFVLSFFCIIIAFLTIGTFLLVDDGVDIETAFTLVASSINNIGIAFRAAGPSETCAFLTNKQLILCSFLMLLGRLEFFVILTLFVPSFWKR